MITHGLSIEFKIIRNVYFFVNFTYLFKTVLDYKSGKKMFLLQNSLYLFPSVFHIPQLARQTIFFRVLISQI